MTHSSFESPFAPAKRWILRIVAHPRIDLFLMLLHVAAAAYAFSTGHNFSDDDKARAWDTLWHAIPLSELQHHFLSSLWYLHAQPPLFEVWGWLWLKIFGINHFPACIQFGYVILGTATVGLTARLARVMTGSPVIALVAGLGMSLNPALLYFEAFLLYEVPVIFLLTASAWCLLRALQSRTTGWLFAFFYALNALVLTRSLYHVVFLAGALGFAYPMLRALRWKAVAVAIMVLALPTAWYTKNAVQYGFFGSSSWYGMSLFRTVASGYEYSERRALMNEGALPEAVEKMTAFQHQPSEYVKYGFAKTSEVPLLSRDNFHNINIPDITFAYSSAARMLIARNPWHYLEAVHSAYKRFSQPPSRFYLLGDQDKHLFWEPLYSKLLYGQIATNAIDFFTGVDLGSLFYFYFPLLTTFGVLWVRSRVRRNDPDTSRTLVVCYMLYCCVYVAGISNLMENGENSRFRFATEPLTLILALLWIQQMLQKRERAYLERAHASA